MDEKTELKFYKDEAPTMRPLRETMRQRHSSLRSLGFHSEAEAQKNAERTRDALCLHLPL